MKINIDFIEGKTLENTSFKHIFMKFDLKIILMVLFFFSILFLSYVN